MWSPTAAFHEFGTHSAGERVVRASDLCQFLNSLACVHTAMARFQESAKQELSSRGHLLANLKISCYAWCWWVAGEAFGAGGGDGWQLSVGACPHTPLLVDRLLTCLDLAPRSTENGRRDPHICFTQATMHEVFCARDLRFTRRVTRTSVVTTLRWSSVGCCWCLRKLLQSCSRGSTSQPGSPS
jgi:hypothetical protein